MEWQSAIAALRAQRVIIFDGLFSNLSDEKLINDALEGLKYVGGNFQLIGLMHNPRYVNNPTYFQPSIYLQLTPITRIFIPVA